MATNIELKEKNVRQSFLEITEELEKWGAYVDKVLNEYLGVCFSSHEHIQSYASHRVKDVDSYCEKVLLRYHFENPLLDTTDKVGTRVVLLDREDVKRVSDFVRSSDAWVMQEQTRDTDDVILQQPDVFTYQSDHFIVKPRRDYPTKVDFDILTCEIQVRTILQHAYAEISHDTVYKKNSVTNNKAKRILASSMAMLETADEKFVGLYKELEKGDDLFGSLQKKLVAIYTQVFPTYDDSKYSVDVANKLLFIYSEADIRQVSDEIESFAADPNTNLKEVLQTYHEMSILFGHPIVIVALYGIVNLQNRTKNNWPYSYDSLKIIIQSMGISLDIIN